MKPESSVECQVPVTVRIKVPVEFDSHNRAELHLRTDLDGIGEAIAAALDEAAAAIRASRIGRL